MSELESLLVFLNDPRLAPYAIGDVPAWLWSADAARILWGNPTAAAIFNAASPSALAGHTIDPKGTAALQIARLAGTLPHGASPRLERLRGFGGRMGGGLLCACSRITLANRTPAIFVVATEAAGPRLPLAEQARRLLAGVGDPAALFAIDGSLLAATPAAQMTLGRVTALTALNAAQLGATALASGRADGASKIGKISLHRIGTERAVTLLAALEPGTESARSTEPPTAPWETAATALAPKPEQPPVAAPGPPAVTSASPSPSAVAPSSPVPPSEKSAPKPEPPRTTTPASTERRQPMRFVWQMDDASRFTLGSDEFKAVLGPRHGGCFGPSMGRDRTNAVARLRRTGCAGIRLARHLERHQCCLSGGRQRLQALRRTLRPSGVRPRPQLPRLSRFRRLPRPRADNANSPKRVTNARPARTEPPVFRDERSAGSVAGGGEHRAVSEHIGGRLADA